MVMGMASCRNCIHSGFCYLTIRDEGTPCEFVDKTKLVEVVRCKDCRFILDRVDGTHGCYRHFMGDCNHNDFCSYGERKDND
jgi:hypothetical protein